MRKVVHLFIAFAVLFILFCTRNSESYEPMSEPIDPAYEIPEEPIIDVTEEKKEFDLTIPEMELRDPEPAADIDYYNFNKVMYF